MNSETTPKIGLIGAISIIVGCVVGSSIFILLGPIAAKTGPSIWLAYLIASIPAFVGALYFCQLGSAMPSKGAVFSYTYELLGPKAAAVSTWMFIMAGIAATAAMGVGFGQYLHFYFPSIPILPTAIGIIIFLYLVNLGGLKSATTTQIVMTFIIVASLLMFAIPGLFHITEYTKVETMFPFGQSGLLFAAVTAFFSYTGYQIISEMGSEVKNPGKNLPKAIIIGLLTVTSLYVFVAYVTTGVLNWQDVVVADASLPAAAALFLPNWSLGILGLGALLGVATTINACLLSFPRDFSVLSNIGFLPEKFNAQSKNGSYHFSLTVMAVLALLLIVLGFNVDYLALMTVFGFLGSGIMVGFAAWQLPKKKPEAYKNAPFKLSPLTLKLAVIFGIFFNTIFIILACVDVPIIFALVFIIILITTLYSYYRISKGYVKV